MLPPKWKTAAMVLAVAGLGLICRASTESKLPAFKDDVSRLPAEVAKRYAYLKLGSDNIKWKQIPWVLDLPAAIRLAKEEKRPLLLWVSGDDPLERC
jgi:hypothetical protein